MVTAPAAPLAGVERTVDELLERFVGGDTSVEAELVSEHRRHFRRRVQPLDPSFYPGTERSPEAIESLSNGAFASFASEPTHEGLPAFQFAVARALPAPGFLYYWRASATILYLRREGPAVLRARANIQRNVRLHVRDLCEPVHRGSETRWALAEWGPEQRAAGGASLDRVAIDVRAAGRGKALIRAVLVAAGSPLTRAEISAVLERSSGFLKETPDSETLDDCAAATTASVTEAAIARQQLRGRVESFWISLTEADRRLLVDRGYHQPGTKLRSFRQVAALRPERSGESFRLMERRIFERLRRAFDPEDMPEVTALLVEAISASESRIS